jgi:hypothetical protein
MASAARERPSPQACKTGPKQRSIHKRRNRCVFENLRFGTRYQWRSIEISGHKSDRAEECKQPKPEICGPDGRPYSKDTLGDDFKAVRELVFGKGESRQLADFRRSGTVEALAGDATPEKVSSKMANSLSQANRPHKTYAPVQLASVRDTDAARRRGRAKLREQNPTKVPERRPKSSRTHARETLSD